ncbi:MAG: four helix bundle protein [Fluviicola sp.]|jgi:four helix bundle protein
MATYENFESLPVWQASIELCDLIYNATENEHFFKDFALKDQIRRAVISISSNIAEGYERDSMRQRVYFLLIAKGSCGEVRSQLEIAKRRKYISDESFTELIEKCFSVSKQLKGFMNYLNNVTK